MGGGLGAVGRAKTPRGHGAMLWGHAERRGGHTGQRIPVPTHIGGDDHCQPLHHVHKDLVPGALCPDGGGGGGQGWERDNRGS